ncbi:MAG: response regulator [Proteobacteria bacterium]|nr:response regulator [Pseudomonadota bacterium]
MNIHPPKKRILAIDDEVNFLWFYRFVLRNFYAIQGVQNNALAFNLLRKRHFSLIISDVKRPGGDGLELLQHVLDHPEVFPRKILFCSGWMYKSVGDVRRVLRRPHDLLVGMMSKPFKAQQLRRNIIKMLNGVSPCDV